MANETTTQDPAAVTKLAMKLSQIINEMARVPKNGFNNHFKYKYATEMDIKDAIRPALAEKNIAFMSQIIRHTQEDNRATIEMEFTFICGDTGATINRTWVNHADDKQDKGIAKAATLCTKYFLINCFLISTGDEELDPDSGHQRKSNGKSEDKDDSTQPWANDKNVNTLYTAAQQEFPSLSKPEFLKAAGIGKWTDYDAWVKKYPTGKKASAAKKNDNSPLHDTGEGLGVGSVTDTINTITQDMLISDPVTPPTHMSEVDF